MKLNDTVLPAKTLEEAVHDCFKQDLNSQVLVQRAVPNSTLRVHVSYSIDVSMADAAAALKTYVGTRVVLP